MIGESAGGTRRIKLRYVGRCRSCGQPLPAGTTAMYSSTTKAVFCLGCEPLAPLSAFDARPAAFTQPDPLTTPKSPLVGMGRDSLTWPQSADDIAPDGTAGASARREYDRRKKSYESKTRAKHPILGGLMLVLNDAPQSTNAWATGAVGEERLGRRLDAMGRGTIVMHDRRIPGSRANIDHIVISSSGVFVVDAKRYQGAPRKRVEGGIFSARTERLFVGSRNCTSLVEGMQKQMSTVRSALEQAGMPQVQLRGVLCFVDAAWPLFGGDFAVSGVDVVWPRRLVDRILRGGSLNVAAIDDVHRALASTFGPA